MKWEAVISERTPELFNVQSEDGQRLLYLGHDQAKRYLAALNIADAGVDLGEAKRLVYNFELGGYDEENLYDMLEFIRSIANAVEGGGE